jgi:eukaryotic-like serine/threonine-protein kinase
VAPATTPLTLPDRYRLVGHIANGGMASVWEAHDELLDRPVAVKVLSAHLGEDERARRRFAREARAAAGLSSHPHVVTIYDVGEFEDKSFIVMELLRGGTVADKLRAGEDIPHRVALRWLREAGSALDAAHEAGIVHRDVKPANMLLDTRPASPGANGAPRLALADFGIARLGLEDQITQTGQVLGTAAYISPEQAMGRPSTPASDRYALAVVGYELLTGAKPFRAENFAAQARAHVEDDPPPASEQDLDLPPAVDGVLERGMAKEPEDRWPTAGAMVDALDDALGPRPRRRPAAAAAIEKTRVMDDPTPPPPPARPPRREAAAAPPSRPAPPVTASSGYRPRRRGPVLVAIGALLVVAAAVAAILIAGTGDPGSDTQSNRQAQATETPRATSTPERAERTPSPTATATPTSEATPEPTPSPTATPAPTQQPEQNGQNGGGGGVPSNDPVALQSQAFRLNNAGQADRALPLAQKAVELCKGSSQVSPCAYALFEYARALRMTGDPQAAIAALRERQSRFPDDQPAAVKAELKLAREAAGK